MPSRSAADRGYPVRVFPLRVVPVTLALLLVASTASAAPVQPPPAEPEVMVTEGELGSPGPMVIPAEQVVILQQGPDPRMQRLDRAHRAERRSVIVGAFGVAASFAGMVRMIRTTGTDGAAIGLFTGGYVVAEMSLLAGSTAGLIASAQLRRFGILEDRRGLAISALFLSYIPIAGQIASWALTVAHLRKTSDIARWLHQQASGPTVSAAPFLDLGTRSVGTGIVVRF